MRKHLNLAEFFGGLLQATLQSVGQALCGSREVVAIFALNRNLQRQSIERCKTLQRVQSGHYRDV